MSLTEMVDVSQPTRSDSAAVRLPSLMILEKKAFRMQGYNPPFAHADFLKSLGKVVFMINAAWLRQQPLS